MPCKRYKFYNMKMRRGLDGTTDTSIAPSGRPLARSRDSLDCPRLVAQEARHDAHLLSEPSSSALHRSSPPLPPQPQSSRFFLRAKLGSRNSCFPSSRLLTFEPS